MLRPFRVLQPSSIEEAAAELRRLGEQARVYAGGAELVLLMRHGLVEADVLVDIKRIPAIGEIRWDGDAVRIGAAATHHDIERDPVVRSHLPMLATAAATIGNIRVRNQGTLGGNLCFADPHADPATPLLVYDATVRLSRGGSERQLPLSEFLVGTYETALAPDEVLVEVEAAPLPQAGPTARRGLEGRSSPLAPGPAWGYAFLRIERYHRPTVNVAVAAGRNDGRVVSARLAVGCIGPKATRLAELESKVVGLTVAEATQAIAESKPYLEALLEPVGDGLGSEDYKIHLASVLLARGLTQALGGMKSQE